MIVADRRLSADWFPIRAARRSYDGRVRRVLGLLVFACSAFAGTMTENVASKADAQQTYTLVLPSDYDAAKKYPLLLIFDPRGRGTVAAKLFAEAADAYGWILISSNGTRSDESWEPNERALRALWPEVARYAADPRRIYATGFSGTVMAAWALGIKTGGLAGVIGVGGRYFSDEVAPVKFSFAHYGIAGDADFNNREMRAIDALLEEEKKPHRFRSFEGPHGWMPPELARDAFGWMELWAMKQQRRTRDEALIAKLYERELAAAKSLRDYRAILETYEGLRDVEQVRATVARLERDPATLREQQEEAKADEFESRYMKETMSRIPQIFSELRAAPDESFRATARLLREFRIADLKKRAAKPGAEGAAARRILEAVYAQMAFYLPRALEERGERDLAEATRKVAAEIRR
jgi:predicted esterase